MDFIHEILNTFAQAYLKYFILAVILVYFLQSDSKGIERTPQRHKEPGTSRTPVEFKPLVIPFRKYLSLSVDLNKPSHLDVFQRELDKK